MYTYIHTDSIRLAHMYIHAHNCLQKMKRASRDSVRHTLTPYVLRRGERAHTHNRNDTFSRNSLRMYTTTGAL